MKSFLSYLDEEVMPIATSDGSIDIEKEDVRAHLNNILSNVVNKPMVTPYNVLTKIRKALAYFQIFLPKKSYLDGEKGVEAWEITQFGDKMGFDDKGEWIHHVPGKYYLFFQYMRTGTMFLCTAKIVDKAELDKHLDVAEKMVAESKEKKPVNLTPSQEQDKKIPNSLASYRERIYKARMKQLRKEQIEEDAEAQLEKAKCSAPKEDMHVLKKNKVKQIDELYGKGKLGAITRANYDKAKQHHLGSTHPENPHGQSVSRGNELLRIKNDDAWYKKNGGRGFKRTSKDYETSQMHRDAKKEFLKKHGPVEEQIHEEEQLNAWGQTPRTARLVRRQIRKMKKKDPLNRNKGKDRK